MNKKRPISMVVGVVLAIALGLLGLLGGCLTLGSLFASQAVMAGAFGDVAAADPAFAAQMEMQQMLLDAQASFRPFQIIGELGNILSSLLLVIGAGLLVGRKRAGALLLMGASVLAALVDLYRTAIGVWVQLATREMTANILQVSGAASGQPGMEGMEGFMEGAMLFGLLLGIAWLLAKLAVYGAEIWIARSPAVQETLS